MATNSAKNEKKEEQKISWLDLLEEEEFNSVPQKTAEEPKKGNENAEKKQQKRKTKIGKVNGEKKPESTVAVEKSSKVAKPAEEQKKAKVLPKAEQKKPESVIACQPEPKVAATVEKSSKKAKKKVPKNEQKKAESQAVPKPEEKELSKPIRPAAVVTNTPKSKPFSATKKKQNESQTSETIGNEQKNRAPKPAKVKAPAIFDADGFKLVPGKPKKETPKKKVEEQNDQKEVDKDKLLLELCRKNNRFELLTDLDN